MINTGQEQVHAIPDCVDIGNPLLIRYGITIDEIPVLVCLISVQVFRAYEITSNGSMWHTNLPIFVSI